MNWSAVFCWLPKEFYHYVGHIATFHLRRLKPGLEDAAIAALGPLRPVLALGAAASFKSRAGATGRRGKMGRKKFGGCAAGDDEGEARGGGVVAIPAELEWLANPDWLGLAQGLVSMWAVAGAIGGAGISV